MNEQLSIALAEALRSSKDGIVNISLFVQQQAPELSKEVIRWGLWNNIVWIIISPVIIYCCYLATMKGIEIKKSDEFGFTHIALFWASGILFTIFIITFFNSVENLIKCLVAPKLYLIDYFKNLVNPASK